MTKVVFGVAVALILVSCIGIGTVSGVSFTNKNIVLTFDDLEGGDIGTHLPVGYEGLGWDPNWFYWDADQDPYTAHSPEERISSINYGGWIDFSPLRRDVEFLGAWISGCNMTNVYFNGYHEGVLVGTSATLTPTEDPQFLATKFGSPVDKVVLVSSNFNYFCLDDITFTDEVMIVDEDIKPGEIPNSLNRVSKDPLIVAIVGETELDVRQIDTSKLRLEGIAPLRSSIKDVCSLNDAAGKDGIFDLVMEFDTRTLARTEVLRHASRGDKVTLTITGKLKDGTRLEGKDLVIIIR